MFNQCTCVSLPNGGGGVVIYPGIPQDELECIPTIHDEVIVYIS